MPYMVAKSKNKKRANFMRAEINASTFICFYHSKYSKLKLHHYIKIKKKQKKKLKTRKKFQTDSSILASLNAGRDNC